MKRSLKYIYLGVTILLSVLLIQKLSVTDNNIYSLSPNIYLKKIDYFSQYDVVVQRDGSQEVLVSGVDKIGETEDRVVIKDRRGKLLELEKTSSKIVDPLDISGKHSTNLISPRIFIEKYTLNDSKKLTNQIIILALIVLCFICTMRLFNIKRLDM